MNGEPAAIYHLGVALAIGLLIGVERGWKMRDAAEGARIAGVRTYGLLGLLGGGLALLVESPGSLAFGLGFLGVAGMLSAAYVANLRREVQQARDVSITGVVAGLLTFVFGALATAGSAPLAAAAAVVTTLLLSYKPVLHRWVKQLQEQELQAGLKLLLISVVLLPILPDRGYGPWQALNPYAIWWMVVLIAALSFIGYFAINIGGSRRGILFTGLSAGLASSTALTLHFSRLAQKQPSLHTMLAAGVLLACSTMFPRMLLVASAINPALLGPLTLPAGIMAALTLVPALWYWRDGTRHPVDAASPIKNPLELTSAVSFGLLLALVMLLGKALEARFGETGVLALAAASGIADVDAITLSLADMSNETLASHVAITGIVIAAAVNSVAKAIMAAVAGGREIARRVGLPLLASAVAGVLTVSFRLV